MKEQNIIYNIFVYFLFSLLQWRKRLIGSQSMRELLVTCFSKYLEVNGYRIGRNTKLVHEFHCRHTNKNDSLSWANKPVWIPSYIHNQGGNSYRQFEQTDIFHPKALAMFERDRSGDELTMLRIRTKRNEILISPSKE